MTGEQTTPPATPFYLAAWMAPRVRSGRAAEAAIRGPDEAFVGSPELGHLLAFVGADGRVKVDITQGRPLHRFLLLTFPWGVLAELGPRIVAQCEQLGLTLYDVQHGKLVIPRSKRAAPWPTPEPPAIAALRMAASRVPISDDPEDETAASTAAVRSVLGGVDATSLLPSAVPLPFRTPASLRFAVPLVIPDGRRTKAARSRLLADLRSPRPETRRAAAVDLGGWPAQPHTDSRLEQLLSDDPDAYVRANAAVALAARSDHQALVIARTAEELVDGAGDATVPWAGIAASMALFALTIVAVRSGDAELGARAWLLCGDLAAVDLQRERANALRRVLEEWRPGSR
jgi:hypothetical protein